LHTLTKPWAALPVLLLCAAASPNSTPQIHAPITSTERVTCSDIVEPERRPYNALAPHYSIERRDYTVGEPRVLMLQISVPTKAFYEPQIVGLGCKLLSDIPHEEHINALMFDDAEAAKRLALLFTDEPNYRGYLWHLRGRFVRDKDQQFVEFLFPEVQDNLLSLKRVKVLISPDHKIG
jgi:hypothetical protein